MRPRRWLANYTRTYIERDVRQILNVGDLETFERFLGLCAGRSGQLLSYSALAADTGVSVPTAKRWISVLKTNFLVTVIQPHHRNFKKRMIRSPKLYVTDAGLLCYLLGIRTPEELLVYSSRGAILESFIVSELMKAYHNRVIEPPVYFWRDSAGHEIDVIIEQGENLLPLEIKSGQTVSEDMLKGLLWWNRLSCMPSRGILIHGGDASYVRHGVHVLPWSAL